MGGMGFVGRCFPVCPMILPVWELAEVLGCLFLFGSPSFPFGPHLRLKPSPPPAVGFHERTMRLEA